VAFVNFADKFKNRLLTSHSIDASFDLFRQAWSHGLGSLAYNHKNGPWFIPWRIGGERSPKIRGQGSKALVSLLMLVSWSLLTLGFGLKKLLSSFRAPLIYRIFTEFLLELCRI
jgi:hypothetical protein